MVRPRISETATENPKDKWSNRVHEIFRTISLYCNIYLSLISDMTNVFELSDNFTNKRY
jgi:hypothetical protein